MRSVVRSDHGAHGDFGYNELAMHHHHHDGPRTHDQAFAIGVGLNAFFSLLEIIAGLWIGSLALIADAGHNFSDVLGLLLAWGADWLARRRATELRTFGYGRASILAALFNSLLLFFAIGGIVWEAILRLITPASTDGITMIWVAAIGVVINTATALLFRHGGEYDLNVRGAFLHMMADAAVSLGVVIAGIVIQFTGWHWIDPAISLVIALVIGWSAWGLFRESLDMALDAVPRGINPNSVGEYLKSQPGVVAYHDLHIWSLSTTQHSLSVHLVVNNVTNSDALLRRIALDLHQLHHIEHPTIQLESTDSKTCPTDAPYDLKGESDDAPEASTQSQSHSSNV